MQCCTLPTASLEVLVTSVGSPGIHGAQGRYCSETLELKVGYTYICIYVYVYIYIYIHLYIVLYSYI